MAEGLFDHQEPDHDHIAEVRTNWLLVVLTERVLEWVGNTEGRVSSFSSGFPFSKADTSFVQLETLRSRLDTHNTSDPNLHTILGRLETLVDRQEERIQVLESQLEWVQNRQALCPCIQLWTLALVCEIGGGDV